MEDTETTIYINPRLPLHFHLLQNPRSNPRQGIYYSIAEKLKNPTSPPMNQPIVMQSQQQDQFERLPDELLLHILNKVDDARSLAQCFSVSTRLGSLIPEVHSVSLTIAPPAPKPGRKTSRNRFLSAVFKPVIRFLSRLVSPKSSRDEEDECTCHCPHEILKRFSGIQSLRIELPFCENEIENLKWIADFDTELNSCVVVGWNSLERRDDLVQSEDKIKESAAVDPILTDKELKRRVVWIISTLIAASSRQLMLKELVEDHTGLENVVITDANNQGRLVVKKEGIDVIRKSLPESDPATDNAVVPDLKMKLWHVPELELPESGFVMSGATLIMIRPAKANVAEVTGDDFCGLFGDGEGVASGDERDKAFREALREIKKMKKSYSMEMNSF